jgi:copper(I)-binding protein
VNKSFREIMLIVMVLVSVFLIAACSNKGTGSSIGVVDPWVRSTGKGGQGQSEQGKAMGSNSAAYMKISNKGDVTDRLVKVEGEIAENIELHRSEMKDGVMTMNPVEYIEVSSNDTVELKPGGLHIMLIGIRNDLKIGEQVELILHFEEFGEMTVEAEVRSP